MSTKINIGRIRFFLIAGVIILLLPFLGFPTAWESFFLIAIGVAIVLAAFSLYRAEQRAERFRKRRRAPKEIVTESFVENRRPDEAEISSDSSSLPNENTPSEI